MTQAAAIAASEMTRVSRIRVQIRADSFIYEGYVHLLAETSRIQEVLNDPKPFLNLTEVVIHDRNSATTNHAPYVALNKGAISHVVVLSGDSTGADVEVDHQVKPAEQPAPKTAPPRPPVAIQPTIPPAGPRTVPHPGRGRKASDPPTQPFPRDPVISSSVVDPHDDDVSDLILDDDGGDDIDPDDLERDVGALIGSDG